MLPVRLIPLGYCQLKSLSDSLPSHPYHILDHGDDVVIELCWIFPPCVLPELRQCPIVSIGSIAILKACQKLRLDVTQPLSIADGLMVNLTTGMHL